ncbi:ATP-binding cassette domain-containing protein [Staphylococcus delphini]|uniref:ATP-binding cassette domain-containing protein n=1 Tax=Staphylococcus delphini TaxID=53344 RepID=UPI0021D0302A|nr:ATP-binding cassette domain-containing protein [Staphylococcus delphini]UXS29781.1 ATP-binding cassette domain-containing protein [Staphylococcus delphini]UXS37459.1 ATP-binding cassette domain-containing protein [Staphylococcus delphini]
MTMLKDIYIEFLGKALLTIDRLEILDGDKIAIIGANGSGKTTLLNLISSHFNNFSGIFEKNHDFLYLKQIGEQQ